MLCSIADAVYDVLGYVHPFMTVPHDGLPFSTFDNDNDLLLANCAATWSGAWWYNKCSLWCSTMAIPAWFSRGDATYYDIQNVRMMLKLQ